MGVTGNFVIWQSLLEIQAVQGFQEEKVTNGQQFESPSLRHLLQQICNKYAKTRASKNKHLALRSLKSLVIRPVKSSKITGVVVELL